MKKVFVISPIVLIVAGVAAGYFYFWKDDPKAQAAQSTAKVERGPLRLSVNSTGRVVSNLDVDIKSKASGEVIKLPFDVSDTVKKGELLVELDPIDMQRLLRQSEVALQSSQAKLATAKQNLDVAERTLKTDQARAQAALKAAGVHADDARAKADRMHQLMDKQLASKEDYETAETVAIQAATDLAAAQTKMEELKTQEAALEINRQNVKLAEAQVESDKVSLDIAQDRLNDTKVFSPMDGIVSIRTIQIGTIISSGISNVGGGTTVLTLSDLSDIFVLASVDEADIGKIRNGQNVFVSVDAHPGRRFAGRVVRIAIKGVNVSNVVTFEVKILVLGRIRGSGSGDSASGSSGRPGKGGGSRSASQPATAAGPGDSASRPASQPARGSTQMVSRPTESFPDVKDIIVPDKALLMPEMTANIEIIAADKESVLQVPMEAVYRKGGKPFVTVVNAAGGNDEVAVETGISDGNSIEIVSGLQEGQTVVLRKGAADSKWNAQRQQQFNPRAMMPGGGGGPRGR